jgi:hypothetical protein
LRASLLRVAPNSDPDRAVGNVVRRQEVHLVVVEIAVDDDQVAAFIANACAVRVADGGAGETEVLDRHVALCDENALAVRRRQATKFAMPPTPTIVMSLEIVAKSFTYVPACTAMDIAVM